MALTTQAPKKCQNNHRTHSYSTCMDWNCTPQMHQIHRWIHSISICLIFRVLFLFSFCFEFFCCVAQKHVVIVNKTSRNSIEIHDEISVYNWPGDLCTSPKCAEHEFNRFQWSVRCWNETFSKLEATKRCRSIFNGETPRPTAMVWSQWHFYDIDFDERNPVSDRRFDVGEFQCGHRVFHEHTMLCAK